MTGDSEIEDVLSKFEKEESQSASARCKGIVFLCKECGHQVFGEEDGYVFCAACGVTESKTLLNYEIEFSQTYGGRRIHDRCGQMVNPLLPHSGMSTVIVSGGDERIKRLQMWGSSNQKDQAKIRMLSMIYAKSSKANLNTATTREVETLAVEVCDRMVDIETVYRGKHRLGLIAACFFFAFKKTGSARSCNELADLLDVDVAIVIRGVGLYSDLFQHKQSVFDDQSINPLEFLPRFCNRLHIPSELEELIGQTCISAQSMNVLNNHAVEAKIAACIWFTLRAVDMDGRVSRREISMVCNVSEMTITKCCQELERVLELTDRSRSAAIITDRDSK